MLYYPYFDNNVKVIIVNLAELCHGPQFAEVLKLEYLSSVALAKLENLWEENMPLIISADEIKEKLPNYSPEKAELFHRESARLADKNFEIALKKSFFKEAVLLCGGTASGKTEFLVTQLNRKRCIILDATLSTEEGAGIKLKKIIKANKKAVIYAVIPDDLKRAFIAFLNRDRKFSDAHFYHTHSGSRKTLLWIAINYPETEINIVESFYTSNEKLQFVHIEFDNKQKLIDYLSGKQLTESDIISYIASVKE